MHIDCISPYLSISCHPILEPICVMCTICVLCTMCPAQCTISVVCVLYVLCVQCVVCALSRVGIHGAVRMWGGNMSSKNIAQRMKVSVQ